MRVISGVLTKLKESLVAMAAQVTGLGRKQRLHCCTRKLALVTALEVDGLVWSGRPSAQWPQCKYRPCRDRYWPLRRHCDSETDPH